MLDAAERLFAARGFDGVSVRDITRQAEVEVGLASYHFRSKADLFRETLLRRAPVFAARLAQALEALQVDMDTQRCKTILTAYLDTHIALVRAPEPGWRCYISLAAEAMLRSSRDELTGDAKAIYRPIMQRYENALVACAPHLDSDEVSRVWTIFRRSILSTLIEVGDGAESGELASLRATLLGVFSSVLLDPQKA